VICCSKQSHVAHCREEVVNCERDLEYVAVPSGVPCRSSASKFNGFALNRPCAVDIPGNHVVDEPRPSYRGSKSENCKNRKVC
jgi:hypothetical protein